MLITRNWSLQVPCTGKQFREKCLSMLNKNNQTNYFLFLQSSTFLAFLQIIDSFAKVNPLVPGFHQKVTYTETNVQLKPPGLLKYV